MPSTMGKYGDNEKPPLPSRHVDDSVRYPDDPPAYQTVIDDDSSNEPSTAREDGRIDVKCNSKLSRVLSQLIPAANAWRPDNTSSKAAFIREAPPYPIKLNIVIQVAGSRGDVQPFVALGDALREKHGHRVRIATHNVFESFVRGAGLEFYPIGGDPAELMAYVVKNPGLIPSMSSLKAGDVARKREVLGEMLEGCWKSCIEADLATGDPFVADAIIANPPSFAHIHCAQALAVPLHIMFTMPWSSTRAFPHPLANLKVSHGTDLSVANYVSYGIVDFMTWQGLADLINRWRRHTLDLEAIDHTTGPGLVESLKIPHTYCWSPALVPKPFDWPAHIDVCGFFFRDPPKYDPPAEIREFLEAGPMPVYIGFGSIVMDDSEAITKILLDAVEALNVRAIISRGWSKLGKGLESGDKVLWLGDCPHEWLFQHVSAVVHHGGAGTTACGLLNGRPTTIVPFFGDQPFWGEMVASSGAGPKALPHRSLTVAKMIDAIAFCLTSEAQNAAQDMAAKMRREAGVDAAVASFHRHLPENKACEVLPDQPAVWTIKKDWKTIKLSKKAAGALASVQWIDSKKLKMYETKPFTIDPRRWEPTTAIMSTMIQTATTLGMRAVDVVAEPMHEYRRLRPRSADHLASGTQSPVDSDSGRGRSPTPQATPATLPDFSQAKQLSDLKVTVKGPGGTPLSRQKLAGPSPSSERPTSKATTRSASAAPHPASVGGSVVLAGALSAGSVISYAFKGMIVDLPLAAAEGLLAVPQRTYDSRSGTPAREPVVGVVSGLQVGGETFAKGMYSGFTSIFTKTKQADGALEVARGVGEGVGDMIFKSSGAAIGLVAYPMLGGWKSLHRLVNYKARDAITKARKTEGEWIVERSNAEALEDEVIRRFSAVMGKKQ